MTKIKLTLNLVGIFAVCLLCSSVAQAQATRTWVSGVGDDVNPCSRTAPCKTFGGAISKTAACGEISALEPGGFGTVTITKSLTINGDGTLAGILSAGTSGIIVNAGVNDVVTIRSVSINGAGTGTNGVRFIAGKQVNIENCSISNFTTNGIDVSLGATESSALTVKKTTISGNCSGSPIGIRLITTGNTLKASIDTVYLQGLATGLDVLTGSTATISRSVVSNNSNFGIIAESTGVINADSNVITANNTGISAQAAGSIVRLGNNSISANTTGIVAIGSVFTFGDNKNLGNTTPGAPNQAVTPKQ